MRTFALIALAGLSGALKIQQEDPSGADPAVVDPAVVDPSGNPDGTEEINPGIQDIMMLTF